MRPLAIDLYCGLGGWAEGLLAEGWDVIGFDIKRHDYGTGGYPGRLVIQDVTTLHGSQFKDADLIVASPPCQNYSYMAMPFKLGKKKAADILADESGARLVKLNELFNACFRIQREASEAAGYHIPMVVENVRGAQPWVGRAKWHYGSFFLWGDVPALMPFARHRKLPPEISASIRSGMSPVRWTNPAEHYFGTKGFAGRFEDTPWAWHSSRSSVRKAASAQIAKIPLPLARHVGRVYYPRKEQWITEQW